MKTDPAKIEQSRKWKEKNADRVREYNKTRAELISATPELIERKRRQNAESAKRNYEKRKAYDQARDKEKQRARWVIRNRIYRGTLVRGDCEVCGAPRAQAHHDDYSKPDAVRWLCAKHHKEVHKNDPIK